jgi:flagellar assembly factor FliW
MNSVMNRPITMSTMEITLQHEMLGWVGATHFVLEPIAEAGEGMFAALRCTDRVTDVNGDVSENLTFLVAAPGLLWPDYVVVLDESFASRLGLDSAEDAALLAIVTQHVPLEDSTVNLFSPIVVNRHTGLADQFVPAKSEDEYGWSLRTPLPEGPDETADKEFDPVADAHP